VLGFTNTVSPPRPPFEWRAIKTSLATEPDGGQAVAKEHQTKLDAG
jgi:hypothetical protein